MDDVINSLSEFGDEEYITKQFKTIQERINLEGYTEDNKFRGKKFYQLKIDLIERLLDEFNEKKESFGYAGNSQQLISLLGTGVKGSKQEIYGSKVHSQIMQTEIKLVSTLSKSYAYLTNFMLSYMQ